MEANGCPTPVLMDVASGWEITFMYIGALLVIASMVAVAVMEARSRVR